jgi:hypothetical protein
MKLWISLVTGIYAALLSPLAHADAGWTDYVTVTELVPTSRHYYEVELKGSKNPSGCREKNRYYLNYDSPGADKIFDLFVDSLQSRLQLRVYVSGVCNISGYAEISSVSASPGSP